ncbi:DUF262 domain-containing protein [Corynebacterium striatum]|uniref:DUF262 domain-containing protein n=1 Tax=Corynebacterium striatum TaxID=43770 RepID=UPI00321FF281
MKGEVKQAYTIFDSVEKELIIPVYQRNYDWSKKQCERLFDDLETLITENRERHFFGSIVGNPETSFKWVVIDGQQRLTTLSLYILALTHLLDTGVVTSEDPELARRLRTSYLMKNSSTNEPKFKLKPVKNDATAYKRLFADESMFIEDSNLTANYRYFLERMTKSKLTGDQLWNVIERLDLMILDLESHDDPQRIFESLNSTGLALSEGDKIRNLILMGCEHQLQTTLYENYWNPMEKNIWYLTDWFIRWYLTIKLSRTPKRNEVYDEFKAYFKKQSSDVQTVLGDMYEYSQVMREICGSDTKNAALDAQLERFNLIRGDVQLPLLLPLYRDVKRGTISINEFSRIIRLLEIHIFRRTVASVPTNSLNKIYETMYNDMRKIRGEKDTAYDVLTYLLRRRDGSTGRIPSDEEFSAEFRTRNMYNIHKNVRAYLFDVRENGDSNDTKDIATALENGNVSVEHIMPQTLNAQWKEDLGENFQEIHQTWVNRIGNLTVTGYNSAYSNSNFITKRDREKGFRETGYRLNDDVKTKDKWDRTAMEQRTDALLRRALNYWYLPSSDFIPKREMLPTEPMGDDANFTGRSISAFEWESIKIPVKTWAEFVHMLLKLMAERYRTELINFVEQASGTLVLTKSGYAYSSRVREVDAGLGVVLSTSTDQKISFLRRLFDHLQLDTNEVILTLRKTAGESQRNEEEAESTYSALTVFKSMADDFCSQNVTPEDTQQFENQFAEALEKFRPDEPAAVLGTKPLSELETAEGIAAASAEEIIAAICLTYDKPPVYFPNAMFHAIADGHMSKWLARIEDIDTAVDVNR